MMKHAKHTEHTKHEPPQGDFYVGYLPLPWRHSRALRIIIPAVLWVLVLASSLLSFLRADSSGSGVWDTVEVREWSGLLYAEPYPMLLTETADGPAFVPIVSMLKLGGQAFINGREGKAVTVSGYEIRRDARTTITIDGADSIVVSDSEPPLAPVRQDLGPITVTGEIVDYKCYLGAMKPGEGRTHRACAILCIRGGIPPVLVAPDGEGGRSYYLIVDSDGGPANDAVLGHVAEAVTVTGTLESWGVTNVLRLAATDALVRAN
ncbi:MAG: hypothetical protein AAF747_06055 [Planctomycetota bacterium]